VLAAVLAVSALVSGLQVAAWAQAPPTPPMMPPTAPIIPPPPVPPLVVEPPRIGPEPTRFAPGWYVTPSFSIAEEFDDNVFVSAIDKQWDFVTRFTPGIEFGYRSEPFTLVASGSIDAEIFARNTELSDAANRKRAGLFMRWLPYRLLTVGLDVSYLDTQTPSELVPLTGLQLGRTHATQLVASPSVAYQLTPLTILRSSYAFQRDTIDGGLDTFTHRFRFGVSHQLTPRDNIFGNLRVNLYDTEGFSLTTTVAPTVGWIRQLTPQTLLTLEAGPRIIDDGSVEPELHARIEHDFRLARVALEYYRTETTVVGTRNPSEVESVTGLIEAEPIRLLRLRFEPGFYRTFGNGLPETRSYGFLLSALYPIQQYLTARFNYRFIYQESGSVDLTHNLVTLSLDFGYPIRISP
jgi:hypothetical protein